MYLKRTHSTRFMVVCDGIIRVVTQDIRRRRNVVTGDVRLWWRPGSAYEAKSLGCSYIVRVKLKTKEDSHGRASLRTG